MALTRFDHVSILAHDPSPVIEFYCGVLGFEQVQKREIKEMQMVIYDLKVRDDFIEVIQPVGQAMGMADGIKHIAFESDDIEKDFARFREKGAKIVHKAVQRFENIAFFFIQAPSGEFVEIIQYFD